MLTFGCPRLTSLGPPEGLAKVREEHWCHQMQLAISGFPPPGIYLSGGSERPPPPLSIRILSIDEAFDSFHSRSSLSEHLNSPMS